MDCAIRTDDAMVSRHHARLFGANGQFFVEDLGSANGVYFQEQRVTRHMLNHGDAVRCGSLWLRFVAPELAAATPQAQPDHAASQMPFPEPSGPQPVGSPRGETSSGHVAGYSDGGMGETGPYAASGAGAPGAPAMSPGSGPAAAPVALGAEANEEIGRLNRRIEQLQTALRLYQRGRGEEIAKRIDELEERNEKVRKERDDLKRRVDELENMLQIEGSDAKSQRARALMTRTSELVQQIHDLLQDVRINVMTSEGEFEQFAGQLPRASFELIRESLRSSSSQVDLIRDLLRELRNLAE
ncbi:FHA domain containing protein [Haliangium ochraceum DSM 14365]|uniref:FHA domain containing protein n=2 Tax=Haliangium ochraceum TaxID=80816 RepID=D0LZR0_HALO1|nr:FHA domain containing protein [Haliangium ochraceum DSM 14365]